MTRRPTALVVGAGIAGLTSALRLTRAGFDVEVITRDRPAETTSAVAAALWYPYAAHPADRVEAWARATCAVFAEEAEREDCVWWAPVRELFVAPTAIPRWADAVRGYRRLTPEELPPGRADGHAFSAPVAEMPAYLHVLEQRLANARVALQEERVEDLQTLTGRADVVVHCTGLAARELARDAAVVPIQGQIVRVAAVAALDHVLLDEHHPDGITYAIPRRADAVLGGRASQGLDDPTPDAALADGIVRRCASHVPALAGAEVLAHVAAARPGRSAVRVERDALADGTPLIHNYGHGGSGMTICWGCADEVVSLARA